jgi:hypothetical protein
LLLDSFAISIKICKNGIVTMNWKLRIHPGGFYKRNHGLKSLVWSEFLICLQKLFVDKWFSCIKMSRVAVKKCANFKGFFAQILRFSAQISKVKLKSQLSLLKQTMTCKQH